MRALVTGATGFIGRKLVAALKQQGPPPVVTSRNAAAAAAALGGVRAFAWTPDAGPPADDVFRADDGRPVEVVFHLAGEPVAEGRWTPDKRRRILDSRRLGTRHLVEAIAARPEADRPRVLVSASAVGYYGPRGDDLLDETATAGSDFLAEVCAAWEAEARRAEALGLRVACARIGVVLGEGGGALDRMQAIFKLGLGGRLGDGRQFMPWIHVDDVVGLLLHAAKTDAVRGPLNVVAPEPATNRAFTAAFAAAVHRPAFLPVPAFGLKLVFGDLAGVLLASQRVVPRVAESTGYRFRHPQLEAALKDTLAAR